MKRQDIKTIGVGILLLGGFALIIASYIWAKELIQFENAFIESLGFESSVKYLITVPLVAFNFYLIYKRESIKAKSKGQKVVRSSVIMFSIISLILAVCLIIFSVIMKNA